MNKFVCSGPVRGFLKNRLPAPKGTAALQASRNREGVKKLKGREENAPKSFVYVVASDDFRLFGN